MILNSNIKNKNNVEIIADRLRDNLPVACNNNMNK